MSNRFVATRFVKTALEFPEKTVLEIYDIARERERFRYSEPRQEDIPATVIDKIDNLLSDVRRVQGWLETFGNERTLGDLHESEFNARRFWTALHRLEGMINAFIRVNFPVSATNDSDNADQYSEEMSLDVKAFPLEDSYRRSDS